MIQETIIGRYTLYKWDEPVSVTVRVDACQNQRHYLSASIDPSARPIDVLIEVNSYFDDGTMYVFTAHGIHRYIWRTQRHEGRL